MAVVVRLFAISGVDGYLVDVETMTLYGQPATAIVGLGDAAVKEARQRLESAIILKSLRKSETAAKTFYISCQLS